MVFNILLNFLNFILTQSNSKCKEAKGNSYCVTATAFTAIFVF